LIYRKTKPWEDKWEKPEIERSSSVAIQTVTDKNNPDKNVLQFEDGQENTRRARFCPMIRRRAQTRPSHPPKSKVCAQKKMRRSAKPDTSHIIVEKVARILIAIMFIAFNGLYWTQLTYQR